MRLFVLHRLYIDECTFVLPSEKVLDDNRSMPNPPKSNENGSPIYFDPARVGISLIEVGIDFQEIDEKEITTRWFRDQKSETDVFIWLNKSGQIIKQQVSVMGQLIEWNIVEGVRTGVMLESEFSTQNLMENGLTSGDSASEIIRFDKSVQTQSLELGLSILKHTRSVDPKLLEKMITNFNQGLSFKAFSLRKKFQPKQGWLARILSCLRK